MIYKYFTALLILSGFIYQNLEAQEKWTLQKCIEYAHSNNISIKRQKLNTQYSQNELNKAKLSLLPGVNAQSSYTVNFGRNEITIDSLTYIRELTTHRMDIGARATLPLFEGFSRENTIRKNKYDLLSANEIVQKTKNDISLQIAAYYMQILFDKELLNIAIEQQELTKLQTEKTKKLVDAGSLAMGSYLEIKSQLTKEALSVTQQENNLMISKLNLAQLLDLEDVISFDIVTPDINVIIKQKKVNPDSIYNIAITTLPQIKSSEHNLISAEYQLKTTKGALYPSLSLIAGISSWDENTSFSGLDFSKNLSNNRRSYVGATLSIPIFNGLSAQLNVKNAQLSVNDAAYKLQEEKLLLKKEIQQAYADALAAYKKYISSNEAVKSYEESFRYTEKKFSVGLVTSIEYNTAKNDFTKAQSDLLQSKYEYILRNKILDFYKGIPISL
ncbi:MAG: TolC family protein [Marinilabiliaceae bacterium]|nr:TolC family protein [Marinilabiliaceae bacterium]